MMKHYAPTILWIESTLNAPFLDSILQATGIGEHILFHATDMEETEIMSHNTTPDLIILDLLVLGGGGLPCIWQVRRLFPGVPIIIATGLRDQTVKEASLANGAQDYFHLDNLNIDAFGSAILYAMGWKGSKKIFHLGKGRENFSHFRIRIIDGELEHVFAS